MVNLNVLKEYAILLNDEKYLLLIDKYFKTTTQKWTSGKYYLGGQVPLNPDEDITEDHLIIVDSKNKQGLAMGACNSMEYASMMTALNDYALISDLIKKYHQFQPE